jgi:hypothetical protein
MIIEPETDLDPNDDDDWDGDGIVRAKWILDGATTLAEAADRARAFADALQVMHDQGYLLRNPIEDDYGFIYLPDPPG